MTKETILLPDRLVDLLKLALVNFKAVEKDPRYRINMLIYHSPSIIEKVCVVCFAGSVLAKTLKTPWNRDVIVGDLPLHNRRRIRALDQVRCGHWAETFNEMHEEPPMVDLPSIPAYCLDPEGFKNAVRSAIKRLENAKAG